MTNILLISDDKILRELYKGNHKALEQLFQLYYVLLCYEARKYIPEKYIVEELVNDVFFETCGAQVGEVSGREYVGLVEGIDTILELDGTSNGENTHPNQQQLHEAKRYGQFTQNAQVSKSLHTPLQPSE